jgi:phospholipid/cholesterol/gamma-HCH transport system ATP-binding protein
MSACVLSIAGLRKSFGQRQVHRGVSFELYPNEFLGLMGTSGGGKSLILRSIIGLERPDSGQILFEGRDLTHLSERQLYQVRCRIGYVFQEGALFDSLTVEENLKYPLRLHTRQSEDEIHREVESRLAQSDLVGTNALYPSELSGGMQKRIGFLRATMLRPRVALLDEPTAGLDPPHVRQLVLTAKRAKRTMNVSAIFVTHDADVAMAMCERIAILDRGFIHAIGSSREMSRSEDPVVRGILHPDFGGPCERVA